MQVEVKQPNISESTMREMAKFFMKTSIPRIIEAKKKEAEQNEQHSGTTPSRNHHQ
ncbi:hypothetical protein ACFRCQ_15310 [Cytobacillus firmus]|uniref:hypothetical protein n=1 Tax=Cytobacillus firmus TaxID=1399 RepID=UPI0036C21F36